MVNDKFKMYYSVCQYVPDPIRHEAMNVGIVFHIPQKQYSKFYHIRGTKRLTTFDDECNIDFVKLMYKSLGSVFDMCDIDIDNNFDDISKSTFLPSRIKYYANTFRFLDVSSIYTSSNSWREDVEVLKKTYLYYDYEPKKRITDAKLTSYIKRQVKLNNLNNQITVSNLKTKELVPEKVFTFQSETEFIKIMTKDYSKPNYLSDKFKIFIYNLGTVKNELGNKTLRIITDDSNDNQYDKMIYEFTDEIKSLDFVNEIKLDKAQSYINQLANK